MRKFKKANDDSDDFDLDDEGFEEFMAESDSDDSVSINSNGPHREVPSSTNAHSRLNSRNAISVAVQGNRFVKNLKERAALRSNSLQKDALQESIQETDVGVMLHPFSDTGHFSMRLSDSDPTLTMRHKMIHKNEDNELYNDRNPSEYPPEMTESRLNSLLYHEDEEENDKRKFFDNLEKSKTDSMDDADFEDFEEYSGSTGSQFDENLTKTIGKVRPKAIIDDLTEKDLEEFAQSRDKKIVDREHWNKMTTQNVSLSTQVVNLEMGATARREEIERLTIESEQFKQANQQLKEQLSDLTEEFGRVSKELEETQRQLEKEIKLHHEDNQRYLEQIQMIQNQKMDRNEIEAKSSTLISEMKREYENRVEIFNQERKEFEERMNDVLQRETEARKQLILLQDERESLLSRVHKLSEENTHLADKLRNVRATDVKEKLKSGIVDEKDIDCLKKDFDDQEKILLATQEDNKRLVNQLRENEKELKELRQTSSNSKRHLINSGSQISSNSNREENQMRHHITELEIKLQNQQQLAQEREIELKNDIQVEKKLRQDLEKKLSIATNERNREENKMLRMLEDQLREMERNHIHQVRELEEKVLWFVQNQQIVDKDEDIILEQRKTIQTLREQMESLEVEKKQRKEEIKKGARSPADVKRIKELEQMVENIKKKNHDFNSLPELIRAAKPSPEENEKILMLTKQLKAMTSKLSEAEDALSDDIDRRKRMKIQYETKIQALEDDIELLRNKYHNQPKPAARIKELQTQLDEARSMHHKKSSELEAKIRSLQSQLKRTESSIKSSPASEETRQTIDSLTKKMEIAEKEIQHKNSTIDSLSRKIESLETEIKQKNISLETLNDKVNSFPSKSPDRVEGQLVLDLQKEIMRLTTQVELLQEKLKDQVLEQKVSTQIMKEALKIEEEIGEQEEEDVDRARRVRQLRFLLNRIEDVESKFRLKEMEFVRHLNEQQYKHEVEMNLAKQQYDMSLQEKAREVQKFKVALDAIRAGVIEAKRNNFQQQRPLVQNMPQQPSPKTTPPPKPQPQPEKLFYTRPLPS